MKCNKPYCQDVCADLVELQTDYDQLQDRYWRVLYCGIKWKEYGVESIPLGKIRNEVPQNKNELQ